MNYQAVKVVAAGRMNCLAGKHPTRNVAAGKKSAAAMTNCLAVKVVAAGRMNCLAG